MYGACEDVSRSGTFDQPGEVLLQEPAACILKGDSSTKNEILSATLRFYQKQRLSLLLLDQGSVRHQTIRGTAAWWTLELFRVTVEVRLHRVVAFSKSLARETNVRFTDPEPGHAVFVKTFRKLVSLFKPP